MTESSAHPCSFARRSLPSILRFAKLWPLLAAVALLASPAAAQQCAADGPEARVCSIRVFAALDGQRPSEIDPRRPIALPMGAEATLEIYAFDQYGRDFPRQRLWFGLDTGYSCGGLLETARLDSAPGFAVRAGARQGSCEARLWMPGNLALEWPLVFEVTARARQGYERDEAEFLAARLYEALVARAPDPGGLGSHTVEIQRGGLVAVIDTFLASGEFRTLRAQRTPAQMLDQIYSGLLGRSADSAGVRTFLGAAERGDYRTIVWELVRSEEFERRLLAAARGR